MVMKWIKRLADNNDAGSLAAYLRRQRFQLFKLMLRDVPKPVRILDVGGTQRFWEVMGFVNDPDVHVVLLNLYPVQVRYSTFTSIVGDATDLNQFNRGEFDVVFSNSVIEHLGSFANQLRMAQEIRRVGERYFVQTPNFYFPIEPHFLFPGFQWLPIRTRVWLVMHFSLGWYKKISNAEIARSVVQSIRLLTPKEMKILFPDAMIFREKILITKSLIACRGLLRD